MSYKSGALPRKAKHSKPIPKRDRLIKYLKEIIDETGIKALSHKRLQRIANLFEMKECVFNECKHEAFRYAKRVELMKSKLVM